MVSYWGVGVEYHRVDVDTYYAGEIKFMLTWMYIYRFPTLQPGERE